MCAPSPARDPPAPFDARLRELDLAPVRYQLVMVRGWDLPRIEQAEQQYLAFLRLIHADPATAHAPTTDADEYWHQHILCTTRYVRDCQVLFGAYLHHYPFSGRFGAEDARRQRARNERSRELMAGLVRVES
jgi:hypothetical protein